MEAKKLASDCIKIYGDWVFDYVAGIGYEVASSSSELQFIPRFWVSKYNSDDSLPEGCIEITGDEYGYSCKGSVPFGVIRKSIEVMQAKGR